MNGAKWKYISKQSPFVTFDDAFVKFCIHLLVHYDTESANGSNWVRQWDESESGQIVMTTWIEPILMHILLDIRKLCITLIQKSGRKANLVILWIFRNASDM